MLSQLLEIGLGKMVLAMATTIGAFGGFPDPPKAFSALTQYQFVQWMLVFVLIFQGGGSQDPLFSVAVTIATFLLYKFVRFFENDDVSDDLVL